MSAPADHALFLTLLDSSGEPDPVRAPAELPRQGKLIVGSSADRASFVVTGQGVAEVHCAIGRLKSGGWALKDLGSDFGTLLNGESVETARLRPGDELLIGSRKLRIVGAEAPAKDSEPAPKGQPRPQPKSEPRPAPSTPASSSTSSSTPSSGAKPIPASKPAPSAAPAADAPLAITGYAIDGELGRGAMGRVLKATQTSLDRPVALKLLSSKLAKDAKFVQRFLEEARAAAQLNHSNVVTVYDVGQDGGHHFLSMEYMDGGSVETHLSSKGRFHWREALGVLRDAAAGLVYAESRGIVHRDIKPENLMRNRDGATKIADLGLAVQVEQAHVDGEKGKVFGTPHFLAPELLRGATPDARSDLYSLGATAYRMISGRTPHQGSDPKAIVRSLLSEEPPRLSTLVQGLPASVDELVHGMLAKDPAERTASAGFVVRQIDTALSGAASPAASGRSKAPLFAGVAVLAAALGAWALLGGGGDKPAPPSDEGSGTVASGAPSEDDGTGASTDEDVTAEGTGVPGSGPSAATTGTPPATPPETETPPSGSAELEVEALAEQALDALMSEALPPTERSIRLKQLAEQFNGTDTANLALERAAAIDGGVAEERSATEAFEALRKGAMDGLAALVDPTDPALRPGEALGKVAAFETPLELVDDTAFLSTRREVVESILARTLQLQEDANAAADKATAEGFFNATLEALRGAVERCTPDEATEAFLAAVAPSNLESARAAVAASRARLAGLEGREAEFDRAREQRERTMVSRALGTGFQESLANLDLEAAAAGARQAAGLIRDEALSNAVEESALFLDAGAASLVNLVDAWDQGSWRRKAVIDPRVEDSDFTDVVGVSKPRTLLLPGTGGTPAEVPLGSWAWDPKHMENLFLRRLDRPWSGAEDQGIVALLCVAGTLRGLDALEPSLLQNGKKLRPSQVEAARTAFDEAREWADGDGALLELIARHEEPVRMLANAMLARQEGEWLRCSELLQRLLEEERDSFIVMILSDGGRR